MTWVHAGKTRAFNALHFDQKLAEKHGIKAPSLIHPKAQITQQD
jgi:hypothetical protein